MPGFSLTRRVTIVAIGAAFIAPFVTSAQTRPSLNVHKDPNCGCCNGWVEHLRKAGFSITTADTADLAAVKSRLGVPDDLAACHTAELDRYVIEGHVPARAIDRLLRERPAARGLAVPGMPNGSPGMGGKPEIYEVILFGPSGRRVYGKFRGDREV